VLAAAGKWKSVPAIIGIGTETDKHAAAVGFSGVLLYL
jgi:hypothetical protein